MDSTGELLRSGGLRPADWYEVISVVEKLGIIVISLNLMFRTAGVSGPGYRRWRDNESVIQQRHNDLAGDICRVWEESNRTAGYRKVHAQLVREGLDRCSVDTVRVIMAERGWSSVHPKPWRCLTQQDGTTPAPDLVNRDFTACSPGRKLVGDITQIDTWEGPVFLATTIDLFNREIVGWAMADHHRAELVCEAFNQARKKGLVSS